MCAGDLKSIKYTARPLRAEERISQASLTSKLAFFDCNCMIGKTLRASPYERNPFSFCSRRDLLSNMDYFGIDEAIVFHSYARDYAYSVGNKLLLEDLKDEERLQGCWVLPLHHTIDIPCPEDLVREMLARNVKVARLFPPSAHPYLIASWACGDLLEALEKHRIPVLFAGSDLSRFPDEKSQGFSVQNVIEICEKYPDLPVVILRLNFTARRIIIPMLKKFSNLHIEISYYQVHQGLEFLCKNAEVVQQVLFGTGMPLGNPGAPLTAILYADVSEDDKRLIAGDNLRRLLSLVRN